MTAVGLFAALAVIGLALAAIGAATAQGRAASAASDAIARQPEAFSNIQTAMILSLAFIESQTLFVFAMIFILAGRVS
ncbi:MAG TPA: ATP synthase F0 subunit C [Bacillota bacterium]